MRTLPSRRTVRTAVTVAAVMTVVVAVGADLLAGSHTAHVALVGTIAIALGIIRTRLAGRHRALFGVLSALVVTQPALHAALSGGTSEALRTGLHDLTSDDITTLANMTLAVAVTVGVGVAEKLVLAAEAALRSFSVAVVALLGRAPAPSRCVVPPALEPDRPRSRTWVRYEARRGPPARLAHA